MYATAAIGIYWIVNLRENIVEVRTNPDVLTGQYLDQHDYRLGDTVPLQLPGVAVVQIPINQLIVDAA